MSDSTPDELRNCLHTLATSKANSRFLKDEAKRLPVPKRKRSVSLVLHRIVETARLAKEAAEAAKHNPNDRRDGEDRRKLPLAS